MPAETSFLGVHLAVADMAAAMAFYRLAGLSVPDGADGEGHVQIDVAGMNAGHAAGADDAELDLPP